MSAAVPCDVFFAVGHTSAAELLFKASDLGAFRPPDSALSALLGPL